jgi:proline iminopeptidase
MNPQPIFRTGVIIMIFMTLATIASAAKTEEGFIEVPGGKIWYQIHGADKPGIPLLVVHGGPGAPHDYLESIAELADERPVIFYDQLGCGNSERPMDKSLWTVERYVEELELLRAALKLERLHLLGQSWGTMLSVEYLYRKKAEGIQSLVLSAPYLNTKIWADDQRELIAGLDEHHQKAILESEASGNYASEEYQNAMMAFYAKHLCRMDPWPESMLRTMEKMGLAVYEHMWGPSEFTVTGTLMDADVTPYLAELKLPVLYTCGEFDEATPKSTKYFHELTPDSQLHVFEGASHQHHIEQQKAYNALLRGFFKGK